MHSNLLKRALLVIYFVCVYLVNAVMLTQRISIGRCMNTSRARLSWGTSIEH